MGGSKNYLRTRQEVAHVIGVQPHPGDFYHRLALYEMARHKIDIVKEIL